MTMKNVPTSALNIMLSSLSDSSLKQYDTCLRKWYNYCKQNRIELFSPSNSDILNFLVDLFNQGAQYGTLNTTRSALSLLLGEDVGNNEQIKRLLKGMFRLRPAQPKYSVTWDTSIVLNYLAQWYPNETLKLEQISKKLATLLALVTAHRAQTLTKIKLSNVNVLPTKILINITDLIKTSRPGSTQPTLCIPFFNEKPEICPARTLQSYIAKTEPIRKNVDQLFLASKKPNGPISVQTLSRWIKSTLAASGINVSQFTAHSTRHAATSAAHSSGISLDQIRKTAGWSCTSNTFMKFYNRPVLSHSNDDALAIAVLNS